MPDLIWGYGLDEWCRYGIRYPVKLPMDSHCHALITGPSGSGKSQAVIWLIGKLLQLYPNASGITLTICDFKNSDEFRFLNPYEKYYAGDACYQGILEYYEEFTRARQQGSGLGRHLLICDEYQAMVSYFQAKDKLNKTRMAADILSSVFEILCLGRSLKFSVWTTTQRASSELYLQGSRDNFQIILAFGRQSREQKGMLFSGETLPERQFYAPGEGLLLADGHPLKAVKFPLIEDVDNWKMHILDALLRPSGA